MPDEPVTPEPGDDDLPPIDEYLHLVTTDFATVHDPDAADNVARLICLTDQPADDTNDSEAEAG